VFQRTIFLWPGAGLVKANAGKRNFDRSFLRNGDSVGTPHCRLLAGEIIYRAIIR
jgi:hypothetical protein